MGSMCFRQRLEEQVVEANRKFSGLRLNESQEGKYSVTGILEFWSSYHDKEIEDAYNIEILIPDDYPETVPRSRSVDGKVPKEFHTYRENMTFCTGAPLREKFIFFENPVLISYIEKLLIPYLFSYSCLLKYGELPYGELRHGAPGILEFYKKLFDVEDDLVALAMMSFLADYKYKGHYSCPCGSKDKLRDCHGSVILEAMKYHSKKECEVDYLNIFTYLNETKENNRRLVQYIPNRMRNSFFRKRRRNNLRR